MTRNSLSASPTTLARPTRALSAVTALLFSLLLAPTATFAVEPTATAPAATASAPAAADHADHAATVVTPVATNPALATEDAAADAPEVLEADNSLGMAHDLSPWGMYQNADIIVKIVMIEIGRAHV